MVEPWEVEVGLDLDLTLAEAGLIAFGPDESVAIASGVGDVDVHVDGFLFGDEGGVDPGKGGEFVPEIFFVGPFGDVLGGGRFGFGDLLDHGFGKPGFDGDIDSGYGDFLPRRAQRNVNGFGIPPEIEFAAIRLAPAHGQVRGNTAAHDDEFLSEFGKVWIQ